MGVLYTRYAAQVRTYSYYKLDMLGAGSHEDLDCAADDIAAETFTRWLELLHKGYPLPPADGTRRQLNFLLGIARNLAHQHGQLHQRHAEQPISLAEIAPPLVLPPVPSTAPDAFPPALAAGLRSLSPLRRRILLAHDCEGVTCEALAAQLGTTKQAVHYHVTEGRARVLEVYRRLGGAA